MSPIAPLTFSVTDKFVADSMLMPDLELETALEGSCIICNEEFTG
jgi:hypothetical protein